MGKRRILPQLTRGTLLSVTFYCSAIVCTRLISSCSLFFSAPIVSHDFEPSYAHRRVFNAVLPFNTIGRQELAGEKLCGGPLV